MTHLERLCEFLADTGYDDLPELTVNRAARVTADTVAAIVGGSQEAEMRALSDMLSVGDTGACAVLGTDLRLTPRTAGFLNATAGTFLEMDEGNSYSRGHPGIHALPAALAQAQAQGATGKQFLLALVLGYEVAARIGIGATLRPSMHPHGTWGTVGAAVAAACLGGVTPAQFRETINVASTLGLATSRQTMLQGGTVRNSFAGFAAQNGISAYLMVRAGFVGEHDGLATIWGSVTSERWAPEALTEALGQRYEIARNYFKRHSCCRYNHGALDALAQLRSEHSFAAHDVAAVRVETYSLAAQLDDPRPRNMLAGKFSVPFAIATSLINEDTGLDSFSGQAVQREDIRALATKVQVVEDVSLTAMLPALRPARVQVELHDGRSLSGYTEVNGGDAEAPYDEQVLNQKYRQLTARAWDPGHAQATLDDALNIQRVSNMRDFAQSPRANAA